MTKRHWAPDGRAACGRKRVASTCTDWRSSDCGNCRRTKAFRAAFAAAEAADDAWARKREAAEARRWRDDAEDYRRSYEIVVARLRSCETSLRVMLDAVEGGWTPAVVGARKMDRARELAAQ